MEVFRVFTDEEGKFGNPVGIVVDLEQNIDINQRQKMPRDSGFSEIGSFPDLNIPTMRQGCL